MDDRATSCATEVERTLQGLEAWLRQRSTPEAVAEVVAGEWFTESQVRDRLDMGLRCCAGARAAIAQGQAAIAAWEVLELLRLVAVLPGAALFDPVCRVFEDSDRQRVNAGQKNSDAKALAATLARRLWWDADRERPEPRSTEGCKYIADLLDQEGLGRFAVKTIKGWLSKEGLIPERAKKGGAPIKP